MRGLVEASGEKLSGCRRRQQRRSRNIVHDITRFVSRILSAALSQFGCTLDNECAAPRITKRLPAVASESTR
jgi:hypothetical protein